MAEISDSELEALQKANGVLNALLSDQKHGLNVERIIKEKFPTANTQRLDNTDAIIAMAKPILDTQAEALEAMKKEFSEYRSAQETKAAEHDMRDKLRQVQESYGFTEEGMKQVIETAQTRNLAHDLEAAAALVAAKQPKAAPVSQASSYFPDQPDVYGLQQDEPEEKWKLLRTNPDAFFRNEIMAIDAEFRSQAA